MTKLGTGRTILSSFLMRTTALTAATTLALSPVLLVATAAHADTTISVNTTGGNGGNGGDGRYVLNPGPPTAGGGGAGGAAGDGSGTAASGGSGNLNYASPTGGGGGGSDGGGGGGGVYGTGAGAGGGGAGGVGAALASGMLTNSAVITGGDGGNGGTGGGDYYAQSGAYDEAGGGGGGGGGSGVKVSSGTGITNNGSIIGGNGGGSGAGDGNGATNGPYPSYNQYFPFQNPVAAGNGVGGRGGNGITATSATDLTIINNGIIKGGIGGADFQNDYGRYGGYRQQAGGIGILGQNLTITNNGGGTISAGQGVGTTYAIQLTGGTNSIANSGTIGDIYAGADLSFQNNAGSVGNITLAGATNSIAMLGGTAGSFNLYGATTASGTFTSGVTLNSGATFLVTGADSTHDVSGITTFDNYGGLTIDTGRSISMSTFTNESGATLTLNSGAQLSATTLNLLNGSTIAGAGTLSNGANPLTLGGGSVSATLGGTGGLVKSGTGTLTLTGANTYTGGTTVNGGTLSIADGALGGGDVTLAEGTTIQFTGSSFTTTNDFHITGDPIFDVAVGTTQTVSGVIDDATGPTNPGVVEKTGAGTLALSGANTYSGGTILAAGLLQLGTDSVFNTPGDPTSGIASSAIGTGTLTFGGGTLQAGVDTVIANAIDLSTADGTIDANGHAISLAGLISGAHGLSITSSSASMVTFANAGNSFSGGINVTGSGLTIGESANGDFGSGLVTLNGTGIEFTGADTYANAVNVSGYGTFDLGGNAVTYTGLIADGSGSGAVMVSGGGTLTLKNTANSYTGGTFISGGSTVSIDSDSELGGTAGGVTLGDATTTGTLAITQNITSARTITLNIGGGAISAPFGKTLTLSGQVTGSGGLTVSGPGGIFLTGNTNNYSGGTTIASGSVTAGRANVLGTGPLAIKATGLLDLNNRSQSITSLTDGGDVHGGTIANSAGGAATLTIGSDNSDSAFSGVIQSGSGTISLVKTGTGTLTLSGANTYSGGTVVSAGTLTVGADSVRDGNYALVSSAIGLGAVTLDGGTLSSDSYRPIYNAIQVNSTGGTLDSGGHFFEADGDITDGTGGAGTLTIAGTTNGVVFLGGTNTYSAATVVAAGATLQPSNFEALSANSDYTVNGTLNLRQVGGGDFTIKSLSGNGNVTNNLAGNSTLVIATAAAQTATFDGTISDAGGGNPHIGIAINGAGTQKFTQANSYSGGTTLTSGTLEIANGDALGGGQIVFDGGTLKVDGGYTLGNTIAVNNTGGAIDANGQTLFLNGGIGNGTNGNAGTLTFTDTSGTGNGLIVLQGTSSYGGAVVIDSGAAVAADGANTLPGGAYTVNGTLDITGAQTISSLTGSGSVVGSYGGGPLSVIQASGTSTFSGTLDDNGSNPLSLVKSGAGVMNLSGANTFTGGTTLNAGTLGALNSSALGSGGVTLTGGTLVYGNTVNLANAVTLAGDAALEVDGTDSAIQSGAIGDDSSAHTLQKLGTGTLQLTQANTYSGTTKLTAGTLEIGDAGALGSSTLLFDGGTLKVDGAYTIANDIDLDANGGTFDTNGYDTDLTGTLSSGGSDGALTIAGTGSFKVSGLNNLSGGAVLGANARMEVAGASGMGAGDVSMNAGSAIHFTTTSGTFTNRFLLDGSASFDVDSGLTTTLNNVIADAPSAGSPGMLTKTGAGTLVLTGANTYSGGTALNAGILQVGIDTAGTPGSITASAIGTGTLTFGGGTLQAGGDYTIANAIDLSVADGVVDANGRQFSFSGTITGPHGLTITDSQGGGAVTMAGNNSYAGGTTVEGATVILAGGSSGPSSGVMGGGTITLNGGTLQAGAGGFLVNAIALDTNGGTLLAGSNTYSFGPISDSGGTPGGLVIGAAGDTGTVVLAAGSTYTGGTMVAGGTARARGSDSFGDSNALVIVNDGTTVQYDAGIDITNLLILTGNAKLDVEGTDTATQSGAILDGASPPDLSSLEKTGGGTLILNGSNGYSGKTVISAGTLQVSSTGAIPMTSDVEIASGATMAVDGGIFLGVEVNSLADHAGAGGAVTVGSGTDFFIGGFGFNPVDTTFSGTLTADYLAFDGAGTQTLTGSGNSANQLIICACVTTGGITLSGGHMSVADKVDVESGTLTVQNGAVLEVSGQGFASTGGTVLVTGVGSAITVDTRTGVTTDNGLAASQTVAAGASFTTTGDSYVATDGTFGATATGLVTGTGSVWSADHLFIGAGSVGGNGTFTAADGGKVVATTGISLALGSTLNIGNGGAAGIIDAPTITGGGSNKVVADFTGASTLSAQVTGGLSLTKQGSGTLILTTANSYTGATTISGGVLQVNDGGALGSGAVVDNGTLTFNTSPPTILASVINGSGGLTQQGSGALTLTATDNYTGETSIATGATLKLTGSGSIQSSSLVTADGMLDLSAAPNRNAIKTLAGNGSVLLGHNTLTFLNGSTTFSGSITDGGAGGSVEFQGGSQVLTGNNSWTGTTTLDAGATLTVASPASLGGSSITFLNGSVLKFAGGGTYTQAADFAQVHAPVYDVGTSNVTWSGQITGVGDLAVTGNGGTLTLTNAANSYGGGTEVTGGAALKVDADGELGATATTLQLGDATTTGTLRFGGAFTLNAARSIVLGAGGGVIDTNGNDIAISHVLSGGSLTKAGAGTLILTGANSYAGATVISAGTLQIGDGGTTGSITGSVVDNATLAFNRGDAVTFALAVGGSGGIVHRGSGTLTLSGANSYAGDTAIAGSGALAISTADNIGNGMGALILGDATHNGVLQTTASMTLVNTVTLNAGGGTLATGGTNVTLNGVVGGTGGLAVTGSGSATLAAAATYSGATTIDSGATLALSGAGGVAASSGIADNGTFDISATTSGAAVQSLSGSGAVVLGARTLSITNAAGTFSGVISGSGGVTVASGALTFSGANSYGGTTSIASGATLQVGSGGAIGAGAVVDNGILRFGRSDSVTVSDALSGSGSLIQNGSGNLVLAGGGTFSGSALVNAGTLSVNGALGAAAVTVNAGGTLGGTGTIGATTVASGGTIAPGNSIGTLHINGNLTLASGSTTAIELSPSAADQIAVSGTAALGGTLAFSQGAGSYVAGTDFKLITASSVNGVFSSVTGLNLTGLDANVTYSATAVDLLLTTPAASGGGNSGGGGTVINSFLFDTYGKAPNQIAAGKALAAGSNTGALYAATGNLVVANVAAVPGALGQMAGDIHASIRGAAIEDSRIIRNAILGRLDQAGEWSAVWGSAFGGYGSIAGDGNAAALHHDSAGFIAGVDMPVSDGIRAGIAAAYSTDRSATSGHLSTASGGNGHVIGYAGWTGGAFDLKLGGDYGWGTAHTARQVTALGQSLAGRQDQTMGQVFADAGYRLASEQGVFEPYAGIAHVEVTSGSFAEQGGSAALSGGSATDGLTYGTMGVRAALAGLSLEDIGVAPKIDLGWRHAFDTLKPGQFVSFQNTGTSFTVLGVPLDTDAAALQLGFDVTLTPDAKLSLGYDGTFGSHAQNNAVRGAFQWTF